MTKYLTDEETMGMAAEALSGMLAIATLLVTVAQGNKASAISGLDAFYKDMKATIDQHYKEKGESTVQ